MKNTVAEKVDAARDRVNGVKYSTDESLNRLYDQGSAKMKFNNSSFSTSNFNANYSSMVQKGGNINRDTTNIKSEILLAGGTFNSKNLNIDARELYVTKGAQFNTIDTNIKAEYIVVEKGVSPKMLAVLNKAVDHSGFKTEIHTIDSNKMDRLMNVMSGASTSVAA